MCQAFQALHSRKCLHSLSLYFLPRTMCYYLCQFVCWLDFKITHKTTGQISIHKGGRMWYMGQRRPMEGLCGTASVGGFRNDVLLSLTLDYIGRVFGNKDLDEK